MESYDHRKRPLASGDNNFGGNDSPSKRGRGRGNFRGIAYRHDDFREDQGGFSGGRGFGGGSGQRGGISLRRDGERNGFRGRGGGDRMNRRRDLGRYGGVGRGRGGGFGHDSAEGNFRDGSGFEHGGFAQSLGSDNKQDGSQIGVGMESDEGRKSPNASWENNFEGSEGRFVGPSEMGRGGGNVMRFADGHGDFREDQDGFREGRDFGGGSGQRGRIVVRQGRERNGFRGRGGEGRMNHRHDFGRDGGVGHGRGGGFGHDSADGNLRDGSGFEHGGFVQNLGGDNKQDGPQIGVGMESDEGRKSPNASWENNFEGNEGGFVEPSEMGRGGGNVMRFADGHGDFREDKGSFSGDGDVGGGRGQRGGIGVRRGGASGPGVKGRMSQRGGFGRDGGLGHGKCGGFHHENVEDDFQDESVFEHGGFAQRVGDVNKQHGPQIGVGMESDEGRKSPNASWENNFGGSEGRLVGPSERGRGRGNFMRFGDSHSDFREDHGSFSGDGDVGSGREQRGGIGVRRGGASGPGVKGRMSQRGGFGRGGGLGHGKGGGFDHESAEGNFQDESVFEHGGFAQRLGDVNKQHGPQIGVGMESDEGRKSPNASWENNFEGSEGKFVEPSEMGRGGGNVMRFADGHGDFREDQGGFSGGRGFGGGSEQRGISVGRSGVENGFRGCGGEGRMSRGGGGLGHGRGRRFYPSRFQGLIAFVHGGFEQMPGRDNKQDGPQIGVGMEADERRQSPNASWENNFEGSERTLVRPSERGRGGGNFVRFAEGHGDLREDQASLNGDGGFGGGEGQRGGIWQGGVGHGFRGPGAEGRMSHTGGFARDGRLDHGKCGGFDHESAEGDFQNESVFEHGGFAQGLGGDDKEGGPEIGVGMESDEDRKSPNASWENNFEGSKGRFVGPFGRRRGGGNFVRFAEGHGDFRDDQGGFSGGRGFGGGSGLRGRISVRRGREGDGFRGRGGGEIVFRGQRGLRGRGSRGRMSPGGGFRRGGGFSQDGDNKQDVPLEVKTDSLEWNKEVTYKMLEAVYWNTVETTFWPTVSSFLYGRDTDQIKAKWEELISELKPPTFNDVLDNTKRLLMKTVITKNPKIEGLPDTPRCVFRCYEDSQKNSGETLNELSKSVLCERFKAMNAMEKAQYRVDHATKKKEFDLAWFNYYKEHPEKFQELSKLSLINS